MSVAREWLPILDILSINFHLPRLVYKSDKGGAIRKLMIGMETFLPAHFFLLHLVCMTQVLTSIIIIIGFSF